MRITRRQMKMVKARRPMNGYPELTTRIVRVEDAPEPFTRRSTKLARRLSWATGSRRSLIASSREPEPYRPRG